MAFSKNYAGKGKTIPTSDDGNRARAVLATENFRTGLKNIEDFEYHALKDMDYNSRVGDFMDNGSYRIAMIAIERFETSKVD